MSDTRDYFLYSGPMERLVDFDVIKSISENQKSNAVTLILCTAGGSPDAAYKIGKYLQSKYEDISILISGICKSAGTLLAISANELVFCPYGELGPLDVQMSKQDNLMSLESGLNITEALSMLEQRSRDTFHTAVREVVSGSGGVVSFATAAHSAAELIESMYAPMFGQIDPEEVGSRSRAMRVGEYYGTRLNLKFSNLRDADSMVTLSRNYPSHGFVIDEHEAKSLFNRVRPATNEEKLLIDALGEACRFPKPQLEFLHVSHIYEEINKGTAANGDTDHEIAGEADQGKPNGRASSSRTRKNKVSSGNDSIETGPT
ncbi:SDH family Clp fold serine proteinase [Ruegeria sp.]|uniref:SDH family Clp fold serine proteinase n=1 Tax=Ruegeria sp. TaxID=1879320 RepID=UPI003B5A5B03